MSRAPTATWAPPLEFEEYRIVRALGEGAMGKVFVGLSGYSYKPWIGRFYPEGTKAKDLLEYYASRYQAVEMDGQGRLLLPALLRD